MLQQALLRMDAGELHAPRTHLSRLLHRMGHTDANAAAVPFSNPLGKTPPALIPCHDQRDRF